MKQIKAFGFTLLLTLGISVQALGQLKNITVNYKKNRDNSVDFYYEKRAPGSFTVAVKFKKLGNTSFSGYTGIAKNERGRLFTLRPIDNKKSISFSYTYSYIRGSLNPKADSLFVYTLPFKKGTTIQASEMSFLGEMYFGNERPKNWKAYQFNAPLADTVFSVRKGIVVKITNEFEQDTVSYYTSKKNDILIEHADGTEALYSGFIKNKIFVEVGQTVYPQTALGALRTPGTANGSKLAFQLFYLINPHFNAEETLTERKNRYQYITPYFYTSQGGVILTPGKNYTVDFNEKILTHEFTRKELKAFKKNKSKYH